MTRSRMVPCAECGQHCRSVMIGTAMMPSYCAQCWEVWEKHLRKVCLEETLLPPVDYIGNTVRDFKGEHVHILQIGLGTFGTFLEPDSSWLRILLQAPIADERPLCKENLHAIGVDCLEESASRHERLAKAMPTWSVLKAAVGSSEGSCALWCLPRGARLKVRKWMEQRGASFEIRADADYILAYMENMSNIGDTVHPDFKSQVLKLSQICDYKEALLEKREVECFTYDGVLRKHNASGCEILIVDAEGGDCAIVNGMIHACTMGLTTWPTLVRYETRRENYDPYGSKEEEDLLRRLQGLDYMPLEVGADATLVYGPSVKRSAALGQWADYYYSLICYVCRERVVPSNPKDFSEAVGLGSTQWRGTRRDQKAARRDASLALWPPCMWCCRGCYFMRGTATLCRSRKKRRRKPPSAATTTVTGP